MKLVISLLDIFCFFIGVVIAATILMFASTNVITWIIIIALLFSLFSFAEFIGKNILFVILYILVSSDLISEDSIK